MIKRVIILTGLMWVVIFLPAQNNIMISNLNNPNETPIAINPKHPNELIAGANIYSCYISLDTGRTWSLKNINSTYGVWGDPVVTIDTAGNFYFFHLSNPPLGNWIDRMVCQKSTDKGKTWTNGSYAGLNGKKIQDKPWCVVDRKTNAIYLTWTQFDAYESINPKDSSVILFSKSLDGGNSWSKPIRISKDAGDCLDSSNTVEGAVPCVGPKGEIYVSWAGPHGIVFNKSLDGGNSWLNHELFVDSLPGGWCFDISGIYRANGMPVTACDTSHSPYRGTIYLNWSDQRNGVSNTDIWLSKSTDGGNTWSKATRVNDDNTKRQQFFTWMTIDQTNGFLYFIFYDRRNYTNDSTDVYIAVSKDGGNSFINHKISERPFLPDKDVFFGDYTNITAYNDIIRPVWTRLNNGYLSVWTDISNLKKTNRLLHTKKYNFEKKLNPSSDYTYITYSLHKASKVSIIIYDQSGKEVAKVKDNKALPVGKYYEKINLRDLKLLPGTYNLKLFIDGKDVSEKKIVEFDE
jgi:hypothetical protein